MTTEQWKDIPGYEGIYQASDQGRVRSLDREIKHARFGTQKMKGKVMSTKLHPAGYPSIGLRDREGKRQWVLVHRAVLLAFRGQPGQGEEARHLNDDKLDARLDNLEWGSRSENIIDRQTNGIEYHRNLTECPLGHPLEGENLLPSQLGYGRGCRSCLACNRARSNLKANPDYEPYLKEVSDMHLENILGSKRRLYRRDFVSMLRSRGLPIDDAPKGR